MYVKITQGSSWWSLVKETIMNIRKRFLFSLQFANQEINETSIEKDVNTEQQAIIFIFSLSSSNHAKIVIFLRLQVKSFP